jgi:hypothetical protein
VSDVNNNSGIFNTFIEIEDLPNKEPMWVKAFASARFPEKTSQVSIFFCCVSCNLISTILQSFDVVAIDGDTGINTRICYKLGFEMNKNCKLVFLSYCDENLLKILF